MTASEGATPAPPERARDAAVTGGPVPAGLGIATSASGPVATTAIAPAADARLLRRTRLRLVLWSGGITLLILLVLGAVLFTAVRASLQADSVSRLQDRASAIAQAMQGLPGPLDPGHERPGDLRLELAFGGPDSATLALVVWPNGTVLAPATATALGLPDKPGVAAARAGSTDVRSTSIGSTPVRILSEPVELGGATYVIQVVGDRTTEARTVDALLEVLGIGGLVALAFALGGGWLYSQRALVPIRESLRRQRAFAADASHELRTPLAVVRGNVDYLRRHTEATVASMQPALEDIGVEVDQLTGIVDDLLLLARADSGTAELAREPVDLADVAASSLGGLSPLAHQRGIALALDGGPESVTGDPVRLRQLVTILVDNAIRVSPPGAHVIVRVARAGRDAVLIVDDDGPGIRDADRPHLFERFWRAADAPPGGVGLGLSIAAWIVERHGGTIDGRSRTDGPGARFEVRIPSRPA